MAEISINEYVRTKNGKIVKVTKTNIVGKHYYLDIQENRKIVNHSKNIIDLIEVGDYVNGEKVHSIIEIFNKEEQVIGRKLTTDYRIAQYNGLHNRYYLYEEDIKSIVTKEMFLNAEYKVGE